MTTRTLPAFLALVAATTAAHAATYNWNSGDLVTAQPFTTPGNWLVGGAAPATAPGATDDIATPAQYGNASISGAQTVNNFNVDLTTGWTLVGGAAGSSLVVQGDLTRTVPTGGNVLAIRNGSATNTLDFTVNGAVNLSAGTNFGLASTTQLKSLTVNGLFSTLSSAAVTFNSPSVNLNGGFNAALGGIRLYATAGAGGITTTFITGAANVYGSNDANVQATLTLNGTSGSNTFSGIMGDSSSSAAGTTLSVVKTGGSTQIFSRSQGVTYSGGTVVNGGTLLANNSNAIASPGSGLGTGAVSVGAGGTLGGTGRIAPAAGNDLTLAGTLSPGSNSAATLTFNLAGSSQIEFVSGAKLAFSLGTTSDKIAFVSAGDWLAGADHATLLLTLDSGFSYASTYTIFQNVTTANFRLAAITGYDTANWRAEFSQIGNNYQLSFASVPEPSVTALAIAALGLLLVAKRFFRPADARS